MVWVKKIRISVYFFLVFIFCFCTFDIFANEDHNHQDLDQIIDKIYKSRTIVSFMNAPSTDLSKDNSKFLYYRVNPGDTLFSISKKYNVSLAKLRALNPRIRNDSLNISDRLIIRKATKSVKKRIIAYQIKSGDNLSSIARKHGTSIKRIMKLNRITNKNLIQIGQRINIPTNKRIAYFQMPISGPITSKFGYRKNPFQSKKKSFHNGIDIGAPRGKPFYSVQKGIVAFAGRIRGYGNVIFIVHSKKYMSVYAHAHKNLVKSNDRVAKGTKIGLIGNTGYSTGPHLHFEIRKNKKPIDPLVAIRTLKE